MGLMQGPKPDKDKGKKTSTPFNNSGIFAGGLTGSGSYKYVKPERKMSSTEKRDYLRKAASSDIFRGGVGGSGTSPKSGMYGSGKDRKYVDVPEPNKDSRRGAEAFKGGPTGSGATTAADKKRDAGKGGSHSSGSGSSATAAPGSLNYFMQKTGADGKGNAKNRAYTLYKRAQQNKRRYGA